MKFGMMFSDISRALFRRPATEYYPYVRRRNPIRLRAFLNWEAKACTGCGLCAMDCPASAIHVTVLDRKEKRFVFSYHSDQCIFCGQCVESCRQGALSMANDRWELAALNKEPFTINYGEKDDISKVLAGNPAGETDKPAQS